MTKAVRTGPESEADMASWSAPQFIELIQSLTATIESLQHRIEWFERNLFGTKSERLRVLENAQQLSLGEVLAPPEAQAPAKERPVAGYTRRSTARDAAAEDTESVPFFDEDRVPVETIELKPPELEGAEAGEFEVIGQKITCRLAQRPGSYVILKYVRPVVKRRATQSIHCQPAPAGVIEGSRADVSFLAGLLVDKFAWHLPLYRQHQRLEDAGITVSRPWLTQISQRSVGLLEANKRAGRAHRATDRLHYAAPSAGRLLQLAAVRGVHLGSLTRGLTELLDTHGAAALDAAIAAALAEDAVHLPAVRHFIDLHRAERGASPPIPVTLPDDPRVRDLAVRPHDLAEYEKLAQESPDERSDASPDPEPAKPDDNSDDGGGNDPVA